MASEPLNVLVVSHAAVIPVNQEPFDALAAAGARVTLVARRRLPTRLRGRLEFQAKPGLRARAVPLTVIGGEQGPLGSKGIHVITYLSLRAVIEREKPDVVFVEEEPHSVATLQVAQSGVRFVVHENQNIERSLPIPFEWMRRTVLRKAGGGSAEHTAARDAP